MPKIQCRSEIDAPSGDMHAVVAALSRLAEQTATREGPGPRDVTFDYDASIEVFDVPATGRALVVWTVAFRVGEVCASLVQQYRDAAFADFVDQLGLEWPAMVGIAS